MASPNNRVDDGSSPPLALPSTRGCPFSEEANAEGASDNGGEGDAPLSDLDRRQLPHPDQRAPLPTFRFTSSIPRAIKNGSTSESASGAAEQTTDKNANGGNDGKNDGNERLTTAPASSCPMDGTGPLKGSHQPPGADHWVYPSPQMFFNAMKRKGYTPSEADMATVVMIHNTVNEQVWQHVLQWEALHCHECPSPKLKSFSGHFNKLSPRARLRMLRGDKRPFDRHDWLVDRCGREVRYVIDFYEAPAEPGKQIGIHLDVRPALDSFRAIYDRFRVFSGLSSLVKPAEAHHD